MVLYLYHLSPSTGNEDLKNTRTGKSHKHQISLIASHFADYTAQCSDTTLLPQGYRKNVCVCACVQQASCLLLGVSKEMGHLDENSSTLCKIHREIL